MINFIMLTIGAAIGMMATSMCAMSKLDEEKTRAYQRGFDNGRKNAKKEKN